MNNLSNPNLVQPGQVLSYRLPNGDIVSKPVWPGGCQWTVVSSILDEQSRIIPSTPEQETEPILPQKSNLWELLASLWWLWLIIAIIVVAIISSVHNDLVNRDPITAGPAQVNGGVNNQGAHSRMNELAQNRFPGAHIEIRNIQRGTLSGKGKVFYADGKSRNINLKDVPAYAGEVLVNGKEETIYFLQGCGNDARSGNYMSGNNLVFTPEVIINKDGSESPLNTETQERATGKEEPVVKKEQKNQDESMVIQAQVNESTKIISDCLALVANAFLDKQHAHKVTIEFFNPNNGMPVAKEVLETKNIDLKKEDKG